MELYADYIVFADSRYNLYIAVSDYRLYGTPVLRYKVIAVHEVKRAVANAFKKPVVERCYLIPSDVRYLHRAALYLDHLAFYPAKSFVFTTLITDVGKHLHSQANAEQGFLFDHRFFIELVPEMKLFKFCHPSVKIADSRHYNDVAPVQF